MDIFNDKNTTWEYDNDERHLVYVGSMEELAEETGLSEDKLYEMLGEYEDESLDLIETQKEIDEARRGEY